MSRCELNITKYNTVSVRVVSLNVLIFHIDFTLVHHYCIMHCHDLQNRYMRKGYSFVHL